MTLSPSSPFLRKDDDAKDKRPIPTKICKFCKQIFAKKPNTSQKEFASQQYCSKACKYRGRSLILQSRSKPVYEDRICEYCNKPYNKKPKEAKSKFFLSKFCSNDCKYDALHEGNKGNKWNIGRKAWNDGLTMSEEYREICRNRQLNVQHSPESIEKLRATLKRIGMKGRKTPEGLKSLSESMKKRRPYMKSSPPSSYEITLQDALRQAGIKFRTQEPIKGQPDIFIEENRICIFVDGDYHHANPAKYAPDFFIFKGLKASTIWKHDMDVNTTLQMEGYIVVRIWTSEMNENLSACVNKILAYMVKK